MYPNDFRKDCEDKSCLFCVGWSVIEIQKETELRFCDILSRK